LHTDAILWAIVKGGYAVVAEIFAEPRGDARFVACMAQDAGLGLALVDAVTVPIAVAGAVEEVTLVSRPLGVTPTRLAVNANTMVRARAVHIIQVDVVRAMPTRRGIVQCRPCW